MPQPIGQCKDLCAKPQQISIMSSLYTVDDKTYHFESVLSCLLGFPFVNVLFFLCVSLFVCLLYGKLDD